MPGPDDLTLVGGDGQTVVVPVAEAGQLLDRGWRVEGADDRARRLVGEAKEETYGGVRGQVGAAGAAFARGVTLGGSDALVGAIGGEDARTQLRNLEEVNPGLSTGFEVAGGILPALAAPESLLARSPAGLVARGGRAIAEVGEGAGAIAKLAATTRAGATEGALYGGGQGVSELALSEDPLTFERAASTITSNMFYGGVAGGGVALGLGGASALLEKGLSKAKSALDAVAERSAAGPLPDDLAALSQAGDRAGLRAAEKTELEAIEAGRVAQRQSLADEIAAHRQATKDEKLWLSTKKGGEGDAGAPASTERIPEHKELVSKLDEDGYWEQTLPASEIAARGYYEPQAGGHSDPVRNANAAKAIKEGQRDPIKLVVSKSGKVIVDDGRHRLAAAIEADAPIKVKWSTGFEPAEDMVAVAGREGAAGRAGGEAAGEGVKVAKLGADDARAVREIGKISLEADKLLDRTLRNPKALAENPKRALAGLQQQEHALERLTGKSDALRATFVADTSGARAAALDAVPAALERNRALQAKIAELTAAPASERLGHIASAIDDIAVGGGKKTLAQQMLGGSAFSGAASAVRGIAGLASAIPGVGPLLGMAGHMIAPLAGVKASELVTSKVFGRMAKASADVAARTQRAVTAFLDVGKKAAPAAPVLASKVLAAVRYAPETKRAPLPKATARIAPKLADSYRERSAELRSQVTRDMTGAHVMRPEARAAMAERLAGVRAANPILADRMETLAARRVEFLASKLPRRPDLGIVQLGPDTWTPSDMEMRAFARYAAAVEDPGGVEERLVDGTVTPEDAEALNAVYPERVAEIKRQIVERLPTLQKTLPYARRLALSIFTGVPVDPAMHPAVLAVLQGQFAAEPNTGGGMQAPRAQPAFGSVSAEQPTKAQAHGADQEA